MDARLLGLQAWLGRRFANHGLFGLIVGLPAPEGETGVSALTPSDQVIYDMMAQLDARWGLFTSFVILGGAPHLATARLFEAIPSESVLRCTRMKFDLDNADHLPAAGHLLLVEVLKLLGKTPPTERWDELFGTDDLGVAHQYLLALGGFELATRGALGDQGGVVLDAMLVAIRGGLRAAILGLPALVDTLRTARSATEDEVARAVSAALDAVPTPPDSWQPMLLELGLGAATIVN